MGLHRLREGVPRDAVGGGFSGSAATSTVPCPIREDDTPRPTLLVRKCGRIYLPKTMSSSEMSLVGELRL